MKGEYKMCPESGADLSRETHYVNGRPQRHSTSDDVDAGAGLLTNGERRSSKLALLRYFQRCHQAHAPADDGLYRTAAVALRRLKRESDAWDVWVWFALGEHLAAEGYQVDWMTAHTDLVCPRCHGALKWEDTPRGVLPKCAASCRDEGYYRGGEIRRTVQDLYRRSFDQPLEGFAVLGV